MPSYTLTLAEKPVDILVYLAEHGPATADVIHDHFRKGPVFTGGLNVLFELGFVTRAGLGWQISPIGRGALEKAGWRPPATEEVGTDG